MVGSLNKIKNLLEFYWKVLTLQYKSRASYRINFYSTFVAVVLTLVVNMCMIWVIVKKFNVLAGWEPWQIVFLFVFSRIVQGLFWSFAGGVVEMSKIILSGNMDRYLVTPRSALLMITSENAYIWRLLYNIGFFFLLIYCSIKVNLEISVGQVLLIGVFILSGAILLFSINLMIGSMAFWVLNVDEVNKLLELLMKQFIRYPIQIYGKVLAFIFSFIVPIAFVNYYPSAVLFEKGNNVIFGNQWGYASPIIAALFFFLALKVWRLGLKNYSSTGS